MEKRIERVKERDGLSEKDSVDKINKLDNSRGNYYSSFKDGSWGHAVNYKLCLNSGDLGVDNSAEMIIQYLERTGRLI
jgi:cytidylate kinase